MLIKAVSLLTLLVAACSQIQAQTSTTCTNDAGCSAYPGFRCAISSGCTTGYCACPSGMNMDTTTTTYTCVSPSVKLGASCTKSASCYPATSTTASGSVYGSCPSGTCTCAYGKASSDGMSCNFVSIGSPCAGESECAASAQCTSGTCQCPWGYKSYSDGMNCVPYSVGDTCSNTSATCSVAGYGQAASWGSCATNTCTCASGSKSWTYTMLGQSITICVPNNAQLDLSASSACTNPSTQWSETNLKLCGANLACGTCPGSSSYVCMSTSGSTAITTALATIGLAALLTILLRN